MGVNVGGSAANQMEHHATSLRYMFTKAVEIVNTLSCVIWFCVPVSFSVTFVQTSKANDHTKTALCSAESKSPEQLAALLFCLVPAGPAEHEVVSNTERAQPAEAAVHLNLLPAERADPAVHLNLLPAETAAWLCPRQLEL